MLKLEQMLALFAAGGLGTTARFGLSMFFATIFSKGAPWGTAAINVLGSLGFGLIATLFADRAAWSDATKTIVLTGFFGAFTTFSTYMFEIQNLVKNGEYGRAIGGFAVQNGLGFIAVVVGIWLARRYFPIYTL